MKRFIEVTKQVRQEAAKVFGVTGKMVYLALSYDPKRGESDKARRIREYARKNGGVQMVTCREMETVFDAGGVMTQRFPGGGVLTLDKRTGLVTVSSGGVALVRMRNPTLDMLETAQGLASGVGVGGWLHGADCERLLAAAEDMGCERVWPGGGDRRAAAAGNE